jgi:hypothetical protein
MQAQTRFGEKDVGLLNSVVTHKSGVPRLHIVEGTGNR